MRPSIDDLLKSYGDYLIMKNFSVATRKMYLRTLKRYLRFHDSKFKDQPISQYTAREFVIFRHKQGYTLNVKFEDIDRDRLRIHTCPERSRMAKVV